MENCNNNGFMNPNYDVFHQFPSQHTNDVQPLLQNENNYNPGGGGSNDMVLTNVFVRIPIHPANQPNHIQIPTQHRENQNSREIKSEPIKSELGDNHTSLNQTLLPRRQDNSSVNDSTTSLVTARPKTAFKCHKCAECPFLSISENRLLEHTATNHSPGSSDANGCLLARKLICPGCENAFYARKSLEVHLECDHQMTAGEIQLLVDSLLENQPQNPAESETRKSRIYLKSVDVLRNPDFNEISAPNDAAEPLQQFASPQCMEPTTIDDSMVFIDLINADSPNQGEIFAGQQLSQHRENKISIKNVDILREPVFFENSRPLMDDEMKNFPGESDQPNKSDCAMDMWFVNGPQEAPQENFPAIGDGSNSLNRRGKAKIYIKNVDILKEPIFVPPANLTNIFNVNDNLNLNMLSSSQQDHDRPTIISDLYNFNSNPPRSKIFIKNVNILNQPHLDSYHRKSTNSLHLRTVDELNLMNMNDVQNLMVPLSDQNAIGQTTPVLSSENSKNSDEVNNSYSMLPDLAYNQDTGFNVSETELNPSNWGNFYNFDELETIIDPNLKPSSTPYSHFDLNTPQQVLNEESDQDILFVCAQELIDDTNSDSAAVVNPPDDSRSFEPVADFGTEQHFQTELPDESVNVQRDVVEILDDLENQNDREVIIASAIADCNEFIAPEKGRIYVAGNLMEDRSEKSEAVRGKKGNRGRPVGAKQTGITKLKKMYNLTPETVGYHKCDQDCAFRFRDLANLEYHKRCHTSTQQRMQCPDCNKDDFCSWNTLHTHLWREHKIDMELYSCEHCNFKTPILSRLLNTHIKIHSDERNFKCDQCEKAFKNTKQLKEHRRLHRVATSSTLEVHKCAECESSFGHLKSLKEHIRKKHSGNENVPKQQASTTSDENPSAKYKCDRCSYCSSDSNAYRRHKMTHDNSKKYQCQYCDYACIQSNMYQKHLLRRHPSLASLVIQKCPHCPFSTINRSYFEVHIARHTDSSSELDRSTQSCDIIEDSMDGLTETTVHETFENERNGGFNVSLELDTDHRNKIKVKSNSLLKDPSKFYTINQMPLENFENVVT